MFGFPASTEFGKKIPKQKFYENIAITPALKRVFVERIRLILWRNKLAVTTLNLAAGGAVTEVEVFEIRLNAPCLDEAVLRQIDRAVPYHTLFVLTCDGKAQAWVGCKEAAAAAGSAFKVGRYYHTDWVPEDGLRFRVEGLSLDAVYESLVRQVAGDALPSAEGETLQASVARDETKRRLERQIAALEGRMRKERQLNRRMEMNGQLRLLKEALGQA